MLQIQHIRKEYRTGSLIQKALDDVSLSLRDNEFVAILGPSGSGKTTLLNIIGGLDRYDSGDLIINSISTKKYKDRDWDSYRNHTIGFVFQSYNLIPHQTVLANVELALTISGIGKAERRRRAVEALEKVGLGEQLHKRPNQMSGGQMQRVAIARALVNDPDILLADEPTGALDSETSIQVMDLLREVAKDRLVVMVTHNPELAEEYATRIVRLKDGKILSDSHPFLLEKESLKPAVHQNMGKSSMSFLTALSLSFNNLRTKKARTLLTSFAGSIGIIGIALILSLSTGVNQYIQNVERNTLSQYPLQIQSTGMDMTSMLAGSVSGKEGESGGDVKVIEMVTDMFSTMNSNDLKSLKAFLDSSESGIKNCTNAVEYSYDTVPQIYSIYGDNVRQVNPDRSFDALGIGSAGTSNSMMSSIMSTDVFYEMPDNPDLYESQYDVKAGRWPRQYNECVVVLTSGGGISDFMLYTLGLRDPLELEEMIQHFIKEETIETPADSGSYTYSDIIGRTFKLVNSSDYYAYDSQYQVWTDKSENEAYMDQLVRQGEDLTVVGVVAPSEDASGIALTPGIGYSPSLTRYTAKQAQQSEIVKQQLADPKTNVFTQEPFGEESSGKELNSPSLFTVNESALQKAFQVNPGAFSGSMGDLGADIGSLDLSGAIHLQDLSIDLSDLPPVNLGEILKDLDVTVNPEGMSAMAQSLLDGYSQYAAQHPEADYSGLAEDFASYLSTPEAQEILRKYLQDLFLESSRITITTDNLRSLVRDVMAGYQAYAAQNGWSDPDRFDEYLSQYLDRQEARNLLAEWAQELIPSDLAISPEQLRALAQELAAGYLAYAPQHGMADPSKMPEHFAAYLKTEDGSSRLTQGIAGIVDLNSLQAQITAAVENYMQSSELSAAVQGQIASAMQAVSGQLAAGMQTYMQSAMEQMAGQLQSSLSNAFTIDTEAFAGAFEMNMDEEELAELFMSLGSGREATYESNLQKLGYVDFDVPSGVSIYPKDFESKEQVVQILDGYNARMEKEGREEQVITYTDIVGAMMSSVTDIIDIISYVLIAFVSISLIVSSIMIGVITYISVLERQKEIGILRAIGASKRNISQVFDAETCIIGFCAGLIGILLTLLILIPGNALIHHLAGSNDVSAVLHPVPAVVLIVLSMVLTLVGGLIPSKKAAKSDPVTALRTE